MVSRYFAVTAVAFLAASGLFAQTPVQICTIADKLGNPISGVMCGAASCSPGALYKCSNGPNGTQNNCTLLQACTTACVTQSKASCLAGPAPLSVASTSVVGGSNIGITLQLPDSHPSGANIGTRVDRNDIVPTPFCAYPDIFPGGQTSLSFDLATKVVATPTPVEIFENFLYTTAGGVETILTSSPRQVMLLPGGSEPPPPPIASFTLTPSTIDAAGVSTMDVTLTQKAPASGMTINVTSSNPAIASVIAGGQPQIAGGCIAGGGAYTIQAASSIAKSTIVTIGASSGAAGQGFVTQPLTVVPGCVRNACSGGPSCGLQPDGCGGFTDCGCFSLPGQTCGGGGVANVCGPTVFAATGITLNPSTVTAGQSSVATVTFSSPAPSGAGAIVTLGSTNTVVKVPASITVPAGQSAANFTITTTPVPAGATTSTVSATRGQAVWTLMTVNPTAACNPLTCAAFGNNCGTISDGCGGTLSCGFCSGTQTCGGGGIPNVCGGAAGTGSTGILTVTPNGSGDISSSPSGLTKVQSGHTGTAVFNLGTSITLTTTDGHGAIWTGECNSSGQATKSCTFTFNATGSVAASNQ